MFKVSTKVMMSDTGRARYRDHANNPHKGVGEVIEVRSKQEIVSGRYPFRVRWSKYETNAYKYEDLVSLSTFKSVSLEDYM